MIKSQYFQDEFDSLHLGLQRYIRMQHIPIVERPASIADAPEEAVVAGEVPEPEPMDATPKAMVLDAAPEPEPTDVGMPAIVEGIAPHSVEMTRSRKRRYER